jgi:hypothetical protein
VTEYRAALIAVLDDLKQADVPAELLEIAFAKGLEFHLGAAPAAMPLQQPHQVGTPTVLQTPGAPPDPAVVAPPIEMLARRLSLPLEDVSEVFNFTDTGPELIVASGKLPRAAAAATKDIALLISAARQATGEEWTPVGAIRDVAETYGRLDSGNFATTLKEMQEVFGFRNASARKREVKLNRPGWERAAQLVQRLVAGGDSR